MHRYYDPGTGQFLSVDPLVDATGQPYAYTGDDPVNGVDPNGLSPWGWLASHTVQAWNDTVGSDYSLFVQADQWTGKQIAGVLCRNGANNGILSGALGCGPSQDQIDRCQIFALTNKLSGLQRQLAEHQAKLHAYENDPLGYDNAGILQDALDQGLLLRAVDIYQGRIANLENQIRNFREQILDAELGDGEGGE